MEESLPEENLNATFVPQDTVATEINFMTDWEGCKHVQTQNEILFACPGTGLYVVDVNVGINQ